MQVTPLSAWTCDTCGDQITDPKLGLVTWMSDTTAKRHSFKIVHKSIGDLRCDPGYRAGYKGSTELTAMLAGRSRSAPAPSWARRRRRR